MDDYKRILVKMSKEVIGLQKDIIDGLSPSPTRGWITLECGLQDKITALQELREKLLKTREKS